MRQKIKQNQKMLITTDNWFYAPDGELYRAVFGTVKDIRTDEETLGIKTNSKSTNWYVIIGNMIIAGCQIHYAIETDSFSTVPPTKEITHDGDFKFKRHANSGIYNADSIY